ncbi:hypothetical protein RGQ21_21410 [Kitasatospora aureofaciens]|nr:hypothetical protein RGQ21_21410 [Kitasatospora aureofaciens]
MGPRVRLAYDNGAGQSVGTPARTEAAVRAPHGTAYAVVPACFTMWETGLDKTGLDNFNPLNT